MGVLLQLITSLLVCFPCISLGVFHSTSNLLIYSNLYEEFELQTVKGEGLCFVGSVAGTAIIAILLDKLGRKNCCILAGLTNVMSWTIIACTKSIEGCLAAMFLSSLSASFFLIVPIFLVEICQDSIRGTMTSGSIILYGIGIMMSSFLPMSFGTSPLIYIMIIATVLNVAAMFWMKESPVYLLKKGFEKKAAESISFYRQVKVDSVVVSEELEKIKLSSIATINGSTHKKSLLIALSLEKTSLWKEIRQSRGLRIALTLIFASVIQIIELTQTAIIMYSKSRNSMDISNLNRIGLYIAIYQFLLYISAIFMSDLIGRRLLMTGCFIVGVVCCLVLGTQLQLNWGPAWMFPVITCASIATHILGAATVSFVVLSEVFPSKMKIFMTALVVECYWILMFLFIIMSSLPHSIFSIPPHIMNLMFYIFAVIYFILAIYCFFCIPETKGLSLSAIQTLLTKSRKRNVRLLA